MLAKTTARHAARGRRAHHRWRVDGWPWRSDFSRADSLLMAASGRSTSINFLRYGRSVPTVASPPSAGDINVQSQFPAVLAHDAGDLFREAAGLARLDGDSDHDLAAVFAEGANDLITQLVYFV